MGYYVMRFITIGPLDKFKMSRDLARRLASIPHFSTLLPEIHVSTSLVHTYVLGVRPKPARAVSISTLSTQFWARVMTPLPF